MVYKAYDSVDVEGLNTVAAMYTNAMREIAIPAEPLREVAQSAETRIDWYEREGMDTSAERVREYAEKVREATEGKGGEFASIPAPVASWLTADAHHSEVSDQIKCCQHYLVQYDWWDGE